MKKFLMAVMLMFSFNAMALNADTVASAGFDKLTDQQKAEVIAKVTQTAAQNNGSATTVAGAANEWLNIGERIGKGFAGAAKELGVAANQFVDTPVGKWVAFLIVWHFFGAMAVHLTMGLIFLTIGFFMVRWYVNAMRGKEIQYDTEKTNIFGNYRIKKISYGTLDGDETFVSILMIAGVTILVCVTTFNGW